MMMSSVVATGILILIPLLGIALQIFLSKRENKWLGLILPGVCVVYSLLMVLGMATFTSTTTQITTITEDGQVIENIVNEEKNESLMNKTSMITSTIAVFAISNIPTLVLMGIYFGCREKRKKNLQLEKMNIQDLE